MAGNVALPFFGVDPLPHKRPLLATFSTWLNQHPAGLSLATAADGESDPTNARTPALLQALQDDVNAGGCLTARLKTIGAPPWTITTMMAAATIDLTVGAPAYFSPIILYDSGADKAISINWWEGGAFNSAFRGKTRVFHYSTTVLDGNSDGFVSPDNMGLNTPYLGSFRIVNDVTTLSYYVSPDFFASPLTTFQIHSEPAAGGYLDTIDKVGWGLDRSGAANGSPTTAILWKWFES